MNINANISFKSGRFSGELKHVNRTMPNDSNAKSINRKLTKYNIGGYLFDPWKLIKAHYQPFISKHDRRQIKQHRKNRCYGSVYHYWSTRKANPTEIGVATLGTMNDKPALLKKLGGFKRYASKINAGFRAWVKDYNRRNHYSEIYAYKTNLDEKGASHVHFGVVPLGWSKTGRLSPTMTNAVRLEYHGWDEAMNRRVKADPKKWANATGNNHPNAIGTTMRKLNMKHFHRIEEPKLLGFLGKSLGLDFKLTPTGRHGSYSMKMYKRTARVVDKVKASASTYARSVESSADELLPAIRHRYSASASSSASDDEASQSISLSASASTAGSTYIDEVNRSNNNYRASLSSSVANAKSKIASISSSAVSASASVERRTKQTRHVVGNLRNVYRTLYAHRQNGFDVPVRDNSGRYQDEKWDDDTFLNHFRVELLPVIRRIGRIMSGHFEGVAALASSYTKRLKHKVSGWFDKEKKRVKSNQISQNQYLKGLTKTQTSIENSAVTEFKSDKSQDKSPRNIDTFSNLLNKAQKSDEDNSKNKNDNNPNNPHNPNNNGNGGPNDNNDGFER